MNRRRRKVQAKDPHPRLLPTSGRRSKRKPARTQTSSEVARPRHERSKVPKAPLPKLTSGGCPNGATQERSEFCRMTSKRVFGDFLSASKKLPPCRGRSRPAASKQEQKQKPDKESSTPKNLQPMQNACRTPPASRRPKCPPKTPSNKPSPQANPK